MKVIVYTLFSHPADSFSFNTYIRGLMLNLKLARILYPDWKIVLIVSESVFFANEWLQKIDIEIVLANDNDAFTKKMLWRLKPIFSEKYTHIICRDVDAPLTLRERLCVEDWILSGAVIHAITDNNLHSVPLLGGMIGFRTERFLAHTQIESWEGLFFNCSIDFSVKGADQDFLGQVIYPKFSSEYILEGTLAKCQHYLKGMPKSDSPFCKTEIPQIDLGFPKEYDESNDICLHIGSAGWIEPKIHIFLEKHKEKFLDLTEIETTFDVFYWANQNY
jgi:hypothetical protein